MALGRDDSRVGALRHGSAGLEVNTSPLAILHKAREVGCEFYLSDGKWRVRAPKNVPIGLVALMDVYNAGICAELNRPKTTAEVNVMQGNHVLARRPPVWRPKIAN